MRHSMSSIVSIIVLLLYYHKKRTNSTEIVDLGGLYGRIPVVKRTGLLILPTGEKLFRLDNAGVYVVQ